MNIIKQEYQKFQEDLKHVYKLFSNPRVFLNWVINAQRAHIAILVLMVLVPFVMLPFIDSILNSLYEPLIKTNPLSSPISLSEQSSLQSAKVFSRVMLWAISAVIVFYFLIRDTSNGISLATDMRKSIIGKADRLVKVNPSDSILLYNKAKQWCLDKKQASVIDTRLQTVNRLVTQYTMHEGLNEAPTDPNVTVCMPSATMNNNLIADRYQINQTLGNGAMGVIYLANDTRLNRDVAIKQLAIHLSKEKEILSRFQQEALALARLSHQNIVQVYDFIEAKGSSWIIMEYINGKEFKDFLDESGAIKPVEALKIAKKMVAGLGYAHKKGVIHRDFKPANVLITASGDIKVMDFGIAKLAQSTLHTQVDTMMGSPAYMSPEQIIGKTVDKRSDIYSFGVVLYQMLAGELPFNGDLTTTLAKHQSEPPPSLVDKGIKPELNDIVLRTLAKKPEERYQCMGELAEDLNKIR